MNEAPGNYPGASVLAEPFIQQDLIKFAFLLVNLIFYIILNNKYLYTSTVRRLEITKDVAAGRIAADMRIILEDEIAARKLYTGALPSGAI